MTLKDIENYLSEKYLFYIENDFIYITIPIMKTIKIPKNKELLTIEWLENKLNTTAQFKDLKTFIKPRFKDLNIYVASYGIGIFMAYNSEKNDQINKIEQLLKENNIKFKMEYSNKFYVYRFIISKTKGNLNKIKSLKF